MHRKPRITLVAATALTLALSCASIAQAITVNDLDEPSVPQNLDIEWASSSRWGPSGSVLITHTIKTFAPYRHRPCLRLSTSRRETYSACAAYLWNPAVPKSPPITMTESPAGAPDTVTYRFNSSQIGNPQSYRWSAAIGGIDHTSSVRETLPGLPTIDEDELFPPLDDEPIDLGG